MFTAFYLRVSTAELSVENQAIALKAAGYEATATFTEEGGTDMVRASRRPAFADMLRTFRRINGPGRKRLVVTKIDRLGRDADDILKTMRLLSEAGVQVFVKQLGEVDLASPAGKIVLTVLGGVAEMERALRIERSVPVWDARKPEETRTAETLGERIPTSSPSGEPRADIEQARLDDLN